MVNLCNCNSFEIAAVFGQQDNNRRQEAMMCRKDPVNVQDCILLGLLLLNWQVNWAVQNIGEKLNTKEIRKNFFCSMIPQIWVLFRVLNPQECCLSSEESFKKACYFHNSNYAIFLCLRFGIDGRKWSCRAHYLNKYFLLIKAMVKCAIVRYENILLKLMVNHRISLGRGLTGMFNFINYRVEKKWRGSYIEEIERSECMHSLAHS